MALHRADPQRFAGAIQRAETWVRGLQSRNGGWGAFDADNTHFHLNAIPFADHGALLDPPTADVTARCLGLLAQLGAGRDDPAVAAAIRFLLREQEDDGSWFGRWGTNYIYGTWSVLSALNAVGYPADSAPVRRAAAWLLARQRDDGGWGESGESYWPERRAKPFHTSTASQTAWALLGLMAAGEVRHPAVARGIDHLCATQAEDGGWAEDLFTAVGFPRVFYLRYPGSPQIFPVWALARHRALLSGNRATSPWGM
jgi:squalene-hopene/tetraprenyl-beta-curcumene cyclase